MEIKKAQSVLAAVEREVQRTLSTPAIVDFEALLCSHLMPSLSDPDYLISRKSLLGRVSSLLQYPRERRDAVKRVRAAVADAFRSVRLAGVQDGLSASTRACVVKYLVGNGIDVGSWSAHPPEESAGISCERAHRVLNQYRERLEGQERLQSSQLDDLLARTPELASDGITENALSGLFGWGDVLAAGTQHYIRDFLSTMTDKLVAGWQSRLTVFGSAGNKLQRIEAELFPSDGVIDAPTRLARMAKESRILSKKLSHHPHSLLCVRLDGGVEPWRAVMDALRGLPAAAREQLPPLARTLLEGETLPNPDRYVESLVHDTLTSLRSRLPEGSPHLDSVLSALLLKNDLAASERVRNLPTVLRVHVELLLKLRPIDLLSLPAQPEVNEVLQLFAPVTAASVSGPAHAADLLGRYAHLMQNAESRDASWNQLEEALLRRIRTHVDPLRDTANSAISRLTEELGQAFEPEVLDLLGLPQVSHKGEVWLEFINQPDNRYTLKVYSPKPLLGYHEGQWPLVITDIDRKRISPAVAERLLQLHLGARLDNPLSVHPSAFFEGILTELGGNLQNDHPVDQDKVDIRPGKLLQMELAYVTGTPFGTKQAEARLRAQAAIDYCRPFIRDNQFHLEDPIKIALIRRALDSLANDEQLIENQLTIKTVQALKAAASRIPSQGSTNQVVASLFSEAGLTAAAVDQLQDVMAWIVGDRYDVLFEGVSGQIPTTSAAPNTTAGRVCWFLSVIRSVYFRAFIGALQGLKIGYDAYTKGAVSPYWLCLALYTTGRPYLPAAAREWIQRIESALMREVVRLTIDFLWWAAAYTEPTRAVRHSIEEWGRFADQLMHRAAGKQRVDLTLNPQSISIKTEVAPARPLAASSAARPTSDAREPASLSAAWTKLIRTPEALPMEPSAWTRETLIEQLQQLIPVDEESDTCAFSYASFIEQLGSLPLPGTPEGDRLWTGHTPEQALQLLELVTDLSLALTRKNFTLLTADTNRLTAVQYGQLAICDCLARQDPTARLDGYTIQPLELLTLHAALRERERHFSDLPAVENECFWKRIKETCRYFNLDLETPPNFAELQVRSPRLLFSYIHLDWNPFWDSGNAWEGSLREADYIRSLMKEPHVEQQVRNTFGLNLLTPQQQFECLMWNEPFYFRKDNPFIPRAYSLLKLQVLVAQSSIAGKVYCLDTQLKERYARDSIYSVEEHYAIGRILQGELQLSRDRKEKETAWREGAPNFIDGRWRASWYLPEAHSSVECSMEHSGVLRLTHAIESLEKKLPQLHLFTSLTLAPLAALLVNTYDEVAELPEVIANRELICGRIDGILRALSADATLRLSDTRIGERTSEHQTRLQFLEALQRVNRSALVEEHLKAMVHENYLIRQQRTTDNALEGIPTHLIPSAGAVRAIRVGVAAYTATVGFLAEFAARSRAYGVNALRYPTLPESIRESLKADTLGDGIEALKADHFHSRVVCWTRRVCDLPASVTQTTGIEGAINKVTQVLGDAIPRLRVPRTYGNETLATLQTTGAVNEASARSYKLGDYSLRSSYTARFEAASQSLIHLGHTEPATKTFPEKAPGVEADAFRAIHAERTESWIRALALRPTFSRHDTDLLTHLLADVDLIKQQLEDAPELVGVIAEVLDKLDEQTSYSVAVLRLRVRLYRYCRRYAPQQLHQLGSIARSTRWPTYIVKPAEYIRLRCLYLRDSQTAPSAVDLSDLLDFARSNRPVSVGPDSESHFALLYIWQRHFDELMQFDREQRAAVSTEQSEVAQAAALPSATQVPEGRVVVKAGSVADHPGLAVLGRLANPHHLIVDADESGQLKSVVGSGLKFMARAQETSPPALYEDALCPGYRVAAEQRHPLLDLLPSSLLFENGQGQYRIVASRGQWLYSAGYKLLQQLGPLSALAKDPLAERCRNSQSPYCVFTVSETGFLEADSLEDLVDLVYLMLSTQNDKRAEHACACIEQILFRESVTKQRLDAIEQSLWLLSMLPLPHFPLQEIRVRLLAAIEHVRVMDRTPPPPEGIEDDPYHPNTLLTEWLPCAVILRDLATLPKGGSIDDRRRWMLFQLVERKLSTMVKAQKNRIGKAGTIASSLFEAVGWHNLMELVLPLGVRKQYRRLRRLHGNPTAVISSDALRGAVGALHGYYGARIPGEQFILQLASDPVGILRSYLPDLTAKNSSGRSIWQQLMREIAPQIHQVPRIRDLTALRTTIDSSLPVNTLLSEPLTASRLKENFYGYYVAAETADARLTEQLALAVGGWDAETAYLIRVLSSVKWAPFLLRFSKAKELQLWHSYSLNAAIDKIHASTTNHGLLRAVYRSIDLEPVRTRLVDRLVREGADEVERQVRSQLPTVAIEPLLVKARQAVGLYRAGTGVIDALSSEDDCEAASPEGQNLNAVASIDAEIDALFDALFSIGFELTEETALQPPPMAPFSSSQAESNPVLANRLERINRSSTAYAGQIGSLPMYAAKDADRIVELTIAAHALLQRAGKEIDRAKKKILAQLNNDNQKKFGLQAQRQVTEDDLDRLVLQGNSVDRTGTLPFPADLLPDLDQAWTEIALKETRLKHQLARVIAYLENGELQKAVLELRARRQWTETCAPGRLGRCLLAVEKRAGVLLWDKTVERFLKWIAEVDRSTVSEWIMGLGKTSVGKPAAAEFSADGTHFPVVIWPSQTAATNVSDTSRTAWDVFRKQVHRLRFSREQNITPATLHALLDLHKHIQRDRHALHATRWDISGLDLMRLLVVHNGLTASAMKGSFVRVTRHSQTF